MKKALVSLALLATIWSCEEAQPEGKANMRVNHFTQTCQGPFEGNCLLVQEGADIRSDNWSLFYFENSIEGFAYEAGYIYDLRVEKTHIPNPPQDASSIEYKLIEILKKTAQ